MSAIAWIIFLLFFPACLGLLEQVIDGEELSQQLLTLAILLLCIDQARMAVIDLEQVTVVKQRTSDPRLHRFYQVTISTILWELCGFYGATLWLGWGAIAILLSQIWFHCLAGIQLLPNKEIGLKTWGITERIPVLIADSIGLVLVILWMLQIVPLWIAITLLGIVIAYGYVKYVAQPQ